MNFNVLIILDFCCQRIFGFCVLECCLFVFCLFWSNFAPRLCSHPIMSQDASISQEKIVQTRISCGHVCEEGVMLIQVERFITTETGNEARGPGNCIPSQFT